MAQVYIDGIGFVDDGSGDSGGGDYSSGSAQSPYTWNQTYDQNQPQSPYTWNDIYNQPAPTVSDFYSQESQPSPPSWGDIFGAVNQAFQPAAQYAQQPQQDYQQQPSVADFYSQESTANQSDGTPSDFYTTESGAAPKNYSQPDPFALDFNPENPSESYADYYRQHDPRGIVEYYQQQAAQPALPPGTGTGGGTFGGNNDWGAAGNSVSAFNELESQQAPSQTTGTPTWSELDARMRPTLPYEEGYDPRTGGAANPANLFGYTQGRDYTKEAGDYFGGAIGTANNIVGGAIKGAAGVLSNIGKATDAVADSGIPVVSDIGTGIRNTWEQVVEPAGNFGITSAWAALGGLGRAAGDAFGNVFQGQHNDVGQDLTEALVKQPIVQFANMLADPKYFDAMNGYRDQLIQKYYQSQLAAGVPEAEAQRLTGRYGVKLANPVTMAEQMGQDEFSNLPPVIQAALMIVDPVGNSVYGNLTRPFIDAGKAAVKGAGEAAGLGKLAEAIKSPQQRGYDAQNATEALIPALADHANVTGQALVDVANEFASNPKFQEALGYTPSKETSQLANAVAEEINNAAAKLPQNPAPSFTDVVQANLDAYTDFRYNQNINSGRFPDEVAAFKNAETRANSLFNNVQTPGDLAAVQKAWPGMQARAQQYLDANDQALTRANLTAAVTPDYLSEKVNNNLQLQTGAAKLDQVTGEQVPTRPLEQFGPVAGTILRGPGAVTNNFTSRIWLNSNPGRIARDSLGNVFKSVLEGVNPFGSKKLSQAIEDIGITRPNFSESGLSSELKKGFGDSKAGKAFFTAVNAPGEITNTVLNRASKIGNNPLHLGPTINDTTQNLEAALKGNFYDAKAFQAFNEQSAVSANQLGKQYGINPREVWDLLSNGKLKNQELLDFANKNLGPGYADKFMQDVANARADLRIHARDYGLKATNNAFFSYKKNLIDQALGGWATYPYWTTHNLGWLANHLAEHPYRLAAFSTALNANYDRNVKMGVPEYARNMVLLKKDADGTLHMWNPQTVLPTSLPNDALNNDFIDITNDKKDFSKGKPGDLGSFLFGSSTASGGRNPGAIPSVLQANPVLDYFTLNGMIPEAFKSLNLTSDNFGKSDKKSLSLFTNGSVYASLAAALGWPLDMLRQGGIKVTDLNPNSLLNSLLGFGENASKPISSVEKQLAMLVQNGQLSSKDAKLALASIKDGTWNKAALKALDQVEGDGLGAKVLNLFGVSTTTLNTPRDQLSDQMRQEYLKVKDDKGKYVDVIKTDPTTGRSYSAKEFQPGQAQAFFDKYPGADVLFMAKKSPDEIRQSLQDDVTRQALQDLAKQRDNKSITMQDYYSQLDKLQAANPGYFKSQTQSQLTPEEKAQQRQYALLTDAYHNLTPGFDALQAKAYALKDKGDKAGYQKIVNSTEYRDDVKKQNDFISQHKDWYQQYSDTLQRNTTNSNAELVGGAARTNPQLGGKPLKTLAEREYQAQTSDFHNLTDGFEALQQKAYALKDAGDTTGYKAIVSSAEYKQGQAAQLQYIKQNPDWFAQYQKELAGQGFKTKSLADREYSAKLDEYYSIGGDRFDQLNKQVSDLMNAGDKKGAGKIMSSPEYKAAKAAQSDFLNRNPDFAARFQSEYAAKNGKPMPTGADQAYQDKLSAYENIGGDNFAALSVAQQAYRAKGDTKSANAIYQSPGYQQTLAAKDQFLKDNPDFAAQYFAAYPGAKDAFDKRQKQGYSTGSSGSVSSTSYSSSGSSKSSSSGYTSKATYTKSYSGSGPSNSSSSYNQSGNGNGNGNGSAWSSAQSKAYAQAIQAGKSKNEAVSIANNYYKSGTGTGTSAGTGTGATSSYNSAPGTDNYTLKTNYDTTAQVRTAKANDTEMQGRGWVSSRIGTTPSTFSSYAAAKKAGQGLDQLEPNTVHLVVWQPTSGKYGVWSKAKDSLTDTDQQLISALREYGSSAGAGTSMAMTGTASSGPHLLASLPLPGQVGSKFYSGGSSGGFGGSSLPAPHTFSGGGGGGGSSHPMGSGYVPRIGGRRLLPLPNNSLIKFSKMKRFK